MRFNHVGIPTTTRFEGEIDLPHLKVTVSDHQSNPFGIQWQRYWEGAPYPDLVKTVAHVAFEVDDLEQALRGQDVLIPPNSPSAGVMVAVIKGSGAPVVRSFGVLYTVIDGKIARMTTFRNGQDALEAAGLSE